MPKTAIDLGLVGFEHLGPWSAETVYRLNQIVEYKEEAWTPARDGVQGVEPVEGADWHKFLGSGSAQAANAAAERAEAAALKTEGDATRAETAAGEAAGAADAAGKSAEDAAGSVQVIADNAEAIQAVQENLGPIQGAADNALAAQGAADDAAASAEIAQKAAELAQSIAQGAQGYYPTADKLNEDHPGGQNGQWAIVGDTDTIWVWDSDTSAWVNSGQRKDLSEYYTKDQTDAELDELQTAMNQALTTALGTLSKVATSGSYTDLADKPTIPTVPASLPNPNALTLGGAVSASYDGSSSVSVSIPSVPTALPNPNKLSFSGASSASYDGSNPVTVNIPKGGIGTLHEIGAHTGSAGSSGAPTNLTLRESIAVGDLLLLTFDVIGSNKATNHRQFLLFATSDFMDGTVNTILTQTGPSSDFYYTSVYVEVVSSTSIRFYQGHKTYDSRNFKFYKIY